MKVLCINNFDAVGELYINTWYEAKESDFQNGVLTYSLIEMQGNNKFRQDRFLTEKQIHDKDFDSKLNNLLKD